MKKTVLTYGLISGGVAAGLMLATVPFADSLNGRRGEIVGYTGEGYLERKIQKVRRAGRHDLILAVGKHLNLDPAVAAALPGRIFYYRDDVRPRPLLKFLEEYRATLDEEALRAELPARLAFE